MKLSDKILNLRKKHSMSQEELAEKLNVSRQAISRWEVGSAQPDASNVLQLSKLFNVTTDFLLYDEYESDHDVPVVKETVSKSNTKVKKIIALSIAAIGLLGNFIIYILSRMVEVPIPRITQSATGQLLYEWSNEFTGYSYKYFISKHNLEFLSSIFWIVLVIGFLFAIVDKDKLNHIDSILKIKFGKSKKNV